MTRLFLALLILALRPAIALAEPVPGDACPTVNQIVTSGGPETTGVLRVMRCNGTTWQQEMTIDVTGKTGIATDTPAAKLHVGGEAIIGNTGLACSSTTEGGLRWSSVNDTVEMCDGADWKKIIATGSGGTPSAPPTGTGYFVVSNGLWTGSLGGLAGANALCLTDLQSNNWLNKADAAGRGLLDSSHVEAWLCNSSVCQNALAGSSYTFAASGSPATGGGSFVADGSGLGPGNTQNWSGSNYFGSGYGYWTGRTTGTNTVWGGPNSDCMNNWSPSGGGWNAVSGDANAIDSTRWLFANGNCTAVTNHLVCMVHPGNETPVTPAYFVVTNTTWTGNLGGVSGADAKCLTELTTNTNWKGYTTANANGQLIAAKVKSFLCSSSSCNNLMANQTYSFAKVGDSNAGGASFKTNGSGQGPGNSANWSEASHFSGTFNYWTNRNADATLWYTAPLSVVSTCSDFITGVSDTAGDGASASAGAARVNNAYSACSVLHNLVCFVNP